MLDGLDQGGEGVQGQPTSQFDPAYDTAHQVHPTLVQWQVFRL